MSTAARRRKQLADFRSIISELQKALDEPLTEHIRDSAILRFKLAFEVAWKATQAWLQVHGIVANSPRQALQQAFSLGWVKDEGLWDEIVRARNEIEHLYKREQAIALYKKLPGYPAALSDLYASLQAEASQQDP